MFLIQYQIKSLIYENGKKAISLKILKIKLGKCWVS